MTLRAMTDCANAAMATFSGFRVEGFGYQGPKDGSGFRVWGCDFFSVGGWGFWSLESYKPQTPKILKPTLNP